VSLRCDPASFADLGPARSRFEAVRELHARIDGPPLTGRALLEAASFGCRDGVVVGGHECSTCAHYLNMLPDADRRGVRLRCVFYESDPVTAVMATADRIVTAPADAAGGEVARLACEGHAELVALVDGERVVGVVSAVDARRAPATEAAALAHPPLAVAAETPLGIAAQALAARRAPALFVCHADRVVGLVTPADLAHAGLHG
jgi:CBS-domain-containing membrane protein